ncbi:Spy/CpxP family protein refolding chaperone [Pseudoduganella namucuonensis]|uniref:LTXXQ motif family protein n=1 Tax=Pseudoduganella namucuonensis TaxID=1035707 RepID=A0A1I7KEX9_9BURK|nr:Spy/CpxP family protein refolding chaperone [Pseudoduganella namucuonensis]SFU95987.1 LTXXQ motif family protein [Pseudoduganella namucuonensis]
MNTIRKSLMVAMTALSLGTVGVVAHAADAQGRHGHALTQEQRAAKMAEHKAKLAERIAKHQQALHDSLKLTAAQEPAWAAFVSATTPTLAHPAVDRAALAQLSAPERMEKRLELHKQHLVKQETRLAAVKTFYAQLTAEQKKTFDAATHRMHGRGHGGHGGHHMGGMHRGV